MDKNFKHQTKFFFVIYIFLGLFLNLYQFGINRSLWFDEAMLALNIIEKTTWDLFLPLDYHQSAPKLFLFITKIITVVFGYSESALRFFPFLSFILTIPMLLLIGRKIQLPLLIGIIAIFLFTNNLAVISYSSEFKQYMVDVFVSSLLLFFHISNREGESYKFTFFVILGVFAIYLSNISIFFLASFGILEVYGFLNRDNFLEKKQELFKLVVAGVIWLFSLGFYIYLERDNPIKGSMQSYWADSFFHLKIWESSFWIFMGKSVFTLFGINTGFHALFFMGLGFFIPGYIYLNKHSNGLAFLLVFPILLHILASSLKLYPFGERLILYTIPSVTLVVSCGIYLTLNKINKFFLKSLFLLTIVILIHIPTLKFNSIPMYKEEIKMGIRYIDVNFSEIKVLTGSSTGHALNYYSYLDGADYLKKFQMIRFESVLLPILEQKKMERSYPIRFSFKH